MITSCMHIGGTSHGDARFRVRTTLIVSLFPAYFYVGVLLLVFSVDQTPRTFDTILTATDQALAGNVSFAVGRFLDAHIALRTAAVVAYAGLPVAVMTVAALRWRRLGSNDPASTPLAAALAAGLGVALYLMVPASGPLYRWPGRFPDRPPTHAELSLTLSLLSTRAFRNAMPSLHFAGALLVAWDAWPLGRVARAFGTTLVALTLLATIGTGEHYLVDLIVAIPFAYAIEMVVRRAGKWQTPALVSGSLTVFWIVGLRLVPFLFVTPVFIRIVVIATLGGVSGLAWRMSRTQSSARLAVGAALPQ